MLPQAFIRLLPATSAILFASLLSCGKSTFVPGKPIVDTVITDSTIFIDITLDGKRTLGIYDSAEASPPSWGAQWGEIDPDSALFTYDRVGITFLQGDYNSRPQFCFSMGNVSTGTIWESAYGTADQTGSYFTITAFQLRNEASGYASGVMLTASFACILYDGKGHSIRLTQGRMRQAMWL